MCQDEEEMVLEGHRMIAVLVILIFVALRMGMRMRMGLMGLLVFLIWRRVGRKRVSQGEVVGSKIAFWVDVMKPVSQSVFYENEGVGVRGGGVNRLFTSKFGIDRGG